ncbi:hypothetical protein [Planktothrix agardhii]|uniref:hypothetical protein n=1 Tax=Planktothrix agardhii TaxID=1160 RepID=UPI0011D243F0|nr:hypothetical protein [Planktothrix agardhii]
MPNLKAVATIPPLEISQGFQVEPDAPETMEPEEPEEEPMEDTEDEEPSEESMTFPKVAPLVSIS